MIRTIRTIAASERGLREGGCRGCRHPWIWGDEMYPSLAYLVLEAARKDPSVAEWFRKTYVVSENRKS